MKLKQHVVLAMAQFLNNEDYEETISKVQTMVHGSNRFKRLNLLHVSSTKFYASHTAVY